MSLRMPLYAKILAWLFLNIALAGLALLLLAQTQFHFGLDSLVAGRAGERLQALGDVLGAELNESSRQTWDTTLARFGNAYGVVFRLFRGDGTQLAGDPVQLPEPVLTRIREGMGRRGEGRPEGPGPLTARPENGPPPREGQPPPRRTMVHTTDPSRYWVILRVPMRDNDQQDGERRPRQGPGLLVAESNSLSAGGLFFDIIPWLSVSAGLLIGSTLLWFPFVRGITRAVGQMNTATERIAEGRFDVRVPAKRRDELGSLASSINDMAARLEGLVSGQKRFLGDIAHELCTPIARMQMALGILENQAANQGANKQQSVEDVREELQEMSALVNELLSFSKAALGGKTITLQEVALRPLVENVLQREALPGEVALDIPGELRVRAAADLLQRALANLLRNAERHAGGAMGITAAVEKEQARLTVWDRGPGIPATLREQIFDPFFRLDLSRDRQTGGVGLGLAIVKTCVESSGGTVTCEENPGGGAAFVIRLALADS